MGNCTIKTDILLWLGKTYAWICYLFCDYFQCHHYGHLGRTGASVRQSASTSGIERALSMAEVVPSMASRCAVEVTFSRRSVWEIIVKWGEQVRYIININYEFNFSYLSCRKFIQFTLIKNHVTLWSWKYKQKTIGNSSFDFLNWERNCFNMSEKLIRI